LPFDFGVLGVPMFIVISGFCIHLGYARRLVTGQRGGWTWGAFWKRRFVRLYPTYLCAVALSLLVVWLLNQVWGVHAAVPADLTWDLITHVLMIHNLTADFSGGLGNPPFWTLGLEEQLYALFAIVVLLRTRLTAVRVLAIAATVSLVWRLGYTWGPFMSGSPDQIILDVGAFRLGYWTGWPFGWWFLWVLGALAAECYVGLVRPPRWVTSWWLITTVTAITAVTHWRTLGRYTKFWLDDSTAAWVRTALDSLVQLSEPLFAVACFALLLRLISREREGGLKSFGSRLMAGLGVFSYSLYLTHVPTIEVLNAIFGMPDSLAGTAFRLLVYVPACVMVGAGFFIAFERPFLFLNKRAAVRGVADRAVMPPRAGDAIR
jgi:peptidoglycan/LPS O-acetylase OafA/YrhL